MPAFVEIPAPHMITMFLNLPSDSPDIRSASEKSLEEDFDNPDPMFEFEADDFYTFTIGQKYTKGLLQVILKFKLFTSVFVLLLFQECSCFSCCQENDDIFIYCSIQ